MKYEVCKTCPILNDCDEDCERVLSDEFIITNPNYRVEDFKPLIIEDDDQRGIE